MLDTEKTRYIFKIRILEDDLGNTCKMSPKDDISYYIIQIYFGITHGRVLSGEALYT